MLRSYEHLKKVITVLYTTSNFHADQSFAKRLNAKFVTKPAEREKLNATIGELLRDCGILNGRDA